MESTEAYTYERATRELAEHAGERGQPTLHELMWRGIKTKLRVQNFATVPWGQCWQAAKELGYPLNHEQEEERRRWLSRPGESMPTVKAEPSDANEDWNDLPQVVH